MRYFPVWLVLFLGIFSSCGAAYTIYRWEKAKNLDKYARSADTLALTFQRHLDNSVKIARALAGFYEASENISQDEFARFSRAILFDSSEILSVGFAPRILAGDRANYERKWGRNIWEYNPSDPSAIVPARERAEYFPTTYLEPSDKLQSVLQYDRASQLQNSVTIARARDTATVSATHRLPLEAGNGLGFVLYSPIYRYNAPLENMEKRREDFIGVSFVAIQIAEIVKASLKEFNPESLDLYLYEMSVDRLESALQKGLNTPRDLFLIAYDATTQSFIINPDVSPKRIGPSPGLPFSIACPYGKNTSNCLRTVNLQGQEWSLLVIPTADFNETPWRTLGVLGLGLFGTSLLTLYLVMSLERSVQQDRLLQALTVSEGLLKQQKDELEASLQKLQEAQLQLIHSEKMSGLGQLVAGIAHEINNPINFIDGNINYAIEYSQHLLTLISLYQQHYPQPESEIQEEIINLELDYIRQDFPKILKSMESGVTRIQEIVSSMRNFARKDENSMKDVDVCSGIKSTLALLKHRLKEQGERPKIQIIERYDECHFLKCNAGQLNQVFMNILSNAIDALEEAWLEKKLKDTPKIWIQTQVETDIFKIRIADNGIGIPEEIKQQLFNPFFTTKSVGKGTGLGLSISDRIVRDFHRGKLYCESSPGKGAAFSIEIPRFSP
nr:CHASE domain-containing protein [Oscillatoria sp. FACHB-1406]